MAKGKKKPHGHYCKVCGEHKANEKFSGKGHTAHICKSCSKLTPAERAEEMTLNRLHGMAFRYISETEIKWLRNRMSDKRPAIRDTATEVYDMKFSRSTREKDVDMDDD